LDFFGLLWIIFPTFLLSMNTINMQYDSVHIHMTRAFGLFIAYSGIISYNYFIKSHSKSINHIQNDIDNIDNLFKIRIIISLILLIIMIYDNMNSNQWNYRHIRFGMIGLLISLIIPIMGLKNNN